MNQKDFQLKSDVLNRVKSIHYMRTVMRPLMVKTGLFALGLVLMGTLVSLPHVVHNMLESGNYLKFAYDAFMRTEFPVELVLSGTIIVLALVAMDVVRNVKTLRLIPA